MTPSPVSVITNMFLLIFLALPAVVSGTTYCSFILRPNKYCTYGCCYTDDDCCTSTSWSSWSSYTSYSTVTTAVQAWVIAVIVVGSLIGLAVVISIIVCIVKAVKGSKVTTIHPIPANQPTVAVVSTGGSSAMTSNGQWAQPMYGPTPGGAYGPQTHYGPPVPGMPAPPPYPYTNPPPAAGPSYPQPQYSQPHSDQKTSPL